eukprot:gene12661-10856_t
MKKQPSAVYTPSDMPWNTMDSKRQENEQHWIQSPKDNKEFSKRLLSLNDIDVNDFEEEAPDISTIQAPEAEQ